MASQLRAAQHLLQCEKLETQALSQQVSPTHCSTCPGNLYAGKQVSMLWGVFQESFMEIASSRNSQAYPVAGGQDIMPAGWCM